MAKRITILPGALRALLTLPAPADLEKQQPGSTTQITLPAALAYVQMGGSNNGRSSFPLFLIRWNEEAKGWWPAAMGAVSVDVVSREQFGNWGGGYYHQLDVLSLEIGRGTVRFPGPLAPGTYAALYGTDGEIPEGTTVYLEQLAGLAAGAGGGGPKAGGSMLEVFDATGNRNAAFSYDSIVKGWSGAGGVDYTGTLPPLPRPSNVLVDFGTTWAKGGDLVVTGVRFGVQAADVIKGAPGKGTGVQVFDSLTSLKRSGIGDPAEIASVGLGDMLGLNLKPSQAGAVVWVDDVIAKTTDAVLDVAQAAIKPAAAIIPDGKRVYRVLYTA